MSNTAYLFLHRARVPDRAALQSSIAALGFDLELDAVELPLEASGFLPFTLAGKTAGFELANEPAARVVADNPDFASLCGSNDHCIQLTWHGELADLACALIVGSALSKDFGATWSFEGEPSASAEELLAEARTVVAELEASPPKKSRADGQAALLRKILAPVLEAKGFSCRSQREILFFREAAPDLFHCIDLQIDRADYFVRVYPSSPRLAEDAWRHFPESVACPPNVAYLNAKTGLGGGNFSRFPLKDAATTERIALSVVLPALEKYALPWLDGFKTLEGVVANRR